MFNFLSKKFSNYEETTIEISDIPCAGLRVRTNMLTAGKDCPPLWKEFIPIKPNFPKVEGHLDEYYGVSVMVTDTENFDYWTLAPIPADASAPAGTELFTIPGGKYAKFSVPKLEKLSQCYGFIMQKWFPANQFRADFTRHTIELYDKDYGPKGNFYILFPVTK
jgi:predicted transcriptional regulator YdeE